MKLPDIQIIYKIFTETDNELFSGKLYKITSYTEFPNAKYPIIATKISNIVTKIIIDIIIGI